MGEPRLIYEDAIKHLGDQLKSAVAEQPWAMQGAFSLFRDQPDDPGAYINYLNQNPNMGAVAALNLANKILQGNVAMRIGFDEQTTRALVNDRLYQERLRAKNDATGPAREIELRRVQAARLAFFAGRVASQRPDSSGQ